MNEKLVINARTAGTTDTVVRRSSVVLRTSRRKKSKGNAYRTPIRPVKLNAKRQPKSGASATKPLKPPRITPQ